MIIYICTIIYNFHAHEGVNNICTKIVWLVAYLDSDNDSDGLFAVITSLSALKCYYKQFHFIQLLYNHHRWNDITKNLVAGKNTCSNKRPIF